MRLLLDTHVLLWALDEPTRLDQATRDTLEDPINEVLFSAALVADLPLHHRDPFDRLLVAQAIAEPARLYTADAMLAPYSELVSVIRSMG